MSKQAFVFTVATLLFSAIARATPADPQVIFDTIIPGVPVTPVDAFSFHANGNGGGVFNFENVSGNDWVGMDFFVSLPPGTEIGCGPAPFFAVCEVTSTNMPNGMAMYDIGFDEPLTGGISDTEGFGLDMNNPIDNHPNLDPNGVGGWGAFASLEVVATTTAPEPASFLLLGSGIVAIGAFRRLWPR